MKKDRQIINRVTWYTIMYRYYKNGIVFETLHPIEWGSTHENWAMTGKWYVDNFYFLHI